MSIRCKPSEDVCLAHDEPLISTTLCMTGWQKYPIRTCISLNFCEICDSNITTGQRYFDGGYGRRAHAKCIEPPERKEQG